jgi:hypothetical protein
VAGLDDGRRPLIAGVDEAPDARGGAMPSVADGGPADRLAVARGGGALGPVIDGQAPLVLAEGARPLSVNGGGASESGRAGEV